MIEVDAAIVTGTSGDNLVFVTATPEGAVKADPGTLAWDATNNNLYVKDSGAWTNTGWVNVGTAVATTLGASAAATAKAALKSELQAIVASAATWGEFQTDVAAWTASP